MANKTNHFCHSLLHFVHILLLLGQFTSAARLRFTRSLEGLDYQANRVLKQCNPADVNLADYPQWRNESGYWVGNYSYYKSDGEPFQSTSWPYRHDHYKGFITGNVEGNHYRQRNVFVYPPLHPDGCTNRTVKSVGNGTCGFNGNTKVFFADQNATTCSENPKEGGTIEGDYQGVFTTKTELIGLDNSVLYQVFVKSSNCLFQSQLTTITQSGSSVYRTRTAQGFQCFGPDAGQSISASYYRERKVGKDQLYAELKNTLKGYNVQESDMCAWKDSSTGAVNSSGYIAGYQSCVSHLEQSFEELLPSQ